MSEMAKEARANARLKAERLTRQPAGDVDSSGWREPLGELGEVQTGPRPVSRQNFKSGGKVAGLAGAMRADRKPRKSGGRALVDDYINRDVKEANEDRVGQKHLGGMKRGGRAGKFVGGPMSGASPMPPQASAPIIPSAGARKAPMHTVVRAAGGKVHKDEAQDRALVHKMGCKCDKCSGGRVGRKSGGGNWIAGAVKHPGALHKELGVPSGEKIPAKKLNIAAAKGGKEGERARLAKTLKGLPHKASGGALDGRLQGMRPEGGRLARKEGGKAKKGMNVNIIIAPNPPQQGGPMPPPGAIPPPGGAPVGLHQGAPPPMMPPGAAPAGAPPPMMPRARGGRTSHKLAKPGAYPIENAAGGGLGRLEKAKAYGSNAKV